MRFRLALVAPLVLLAGCTWTGRTDGGRPLHDDNGPDPMQRRYDGLEDAERLSSSLTVEPLDGAGSGAGASNAEAPEAMVAEPTAPTPAGATAVGAGSATGDGAATGRGGAVAGTTGNPTTR